MNDQRRNLGAYRSTVQLDEEIFARLGLLMRELMAQGVSRAHLLAGLRRVLKHDGRRL